MITHLTTVKIGNCKGSPRIWLEGKWLLKSNFEPGCSFDAELTDNELILSVSPKGRRRVSMTKRGTPVLDINNAELHNIFSDCSTVRVVAAEKEIRITQTRIALLIRSRILTPTAGSLFTGGGLLDEAARLAGFEPIFGVEINPKYADISLQNHKAMTMFNASVEEIGTEEMASFKPIGALVMGIPCEPYSRIRRLNRGGQEKRDKNLPPEAHELGDMFVWALRAVEATNPHTIVIEEVPDFLSSAAGYVTQTFLQRLGYTVEGRVLDPFLYGEMTGRKRAIVVATTENKINWPEISTSEPKKLGEILEAGPHDWWDRESKPWPFKHWEAQTAKGNGFAPPILTADSTKIPTIKKRYFAGQGDNPVVGHPEKEGTCRWLTLKEVQRLHGVPDDYNLTSCKTTAGEVIGQGVLVNLFRKIIENATKK